MNNNSANSNTGNNLFKQNNTTQGQTGVQSNQGQGQGQSGQNVGKPPQVGVNPTN